MYSVAAYGKMIADAPRMDAYISALQRVVKPGSVVLDLGCGPGLFALVACQLGARLVYAVEPDDVIELARQMAAANGFLERIVFLQKLSTQVSLPEPAEVIVSDLRGILPWFQEHLPSIRDARNRLLSPGGTLIPRRDLIWAAAVEAPDHYAKLVAPWGNNGWDFNLSAARTLVTNTWAKLRIEPDQLLVEPVCWAEIDYAQFENDNVESHFKLTVKRAGTAHGLSVWFDTELIDGICFSNRPGLPELIYGHAFFPLSEPVQVDVGDRIEVKLAANLIGEDYVWRWHTRFLSETDHVNAEFTQSTFFGAPLSTEQLRKRAASYVPTLNEDGHIQAFILNQMDGQTPLREIAERVLKSFPAKNEDVEDALGRAGKVSQKFSQ